MSLLLHAPNDEYDMEATKILAKITHNSSVEEIATVINDIFSKSNEKFDLTKSIPIARKYILEWSI